MLLAVVAALAAATQGAPGAAPPCSDARYAELDFLLGGWTVITKAPDGSTVEGKARFTRDEVGTCAILERVEIAAGAHRQTGFSMTAFDRPSASWRKAYVESGGSYLSMVGVAPASPGGSWAFDTIRTSDKGGFARETWERDGADHLTYRWQRRKSEADPWIDAAVLDYRRIK
jgi:hypothetical protein